MKNLSKFLAEHVKANLFDNGMFRAGEKFEAALERILHEGIFKYRKDIVFYSPVEEQVERICIDSALMKAEANNPHDQRTTNKKE